MHRLFFASLFFLSVLFPGFSLDFWDDTEPEVLSSSLVAALTPEELAGQVLMLAFPQPVPDSNILSWVERRSLGAVKFFGWNSGTPVQVAEAVATLQSAAQRSRFRIPLLVATDQEGGWVRHIKGPTTSTPGNLSLGASGLPSDAWKTGNLIGAELRQMGINMDFAPSVDLYTNPDAHVIGPRSFSQDPVQAGILGMAWFRGLESQGVIATAKHFPGHGNTADDSHGRLPIVNDDRSILETRELVPYRMLIGEGLKAIMSGHIAFPKISGDRLPASLSPGLIDGLLRRDLGFRGVVITDDLYMEGARPAGWSIAQAAEQALEAGNDLLLISMPVSAQREAWQTLVNRAHQNPAFLLKLQESARRVLLLKLQALKGPRAVPLLPQPSALKVPVPSAEALVVSLTARGATLVARASWPWKSSTPVLVVTSYDGATRAMSARFPRAASFSYDYDFFGADPAKLADLRRRASEADKILFVLTTPGSVAYLKALEPFQEKLGVVSVLSPVYLKDVPWVRDAVAVFGTNAVAFTVAAAVVAGDFVPPGRLPFRFGSFPPPSPGRP